MKLDSFEFAEIKKGLMEELFYGSIAGVAICLIGHPFDTIKTRMQVTNQTLTKTVQSLIKKEGPRAFYKGLSSPLYSLPLINSIVFGTYASTKKLLEINNSDLKFSEEKIILISSMFAGILNSFVASPIELFKTKLQIQSSNIYYKSNLDIIKKIRKVSGFRGIFQGTYLTILRESIGYPCQFLTYEYMLRYFRKKTGKEKLSSIYFMISGACAGVACWTSSYGFDIIKTRVQSKVINKPLSIIPNGVFFQELMFIYKNFGIRGYFVGMGAIMGRACLANACGFWAWELSKSYFQHRF